MQENLETLSQEELELVQGGAEPVGAIGQGISAAGQATGAAVGSALTKGK